MVRRRLIDWKFLAMLTVMLLVVVACWGFVARQRQVEALIDIARRSEQIASDARRDQANADARAAAQVAALRGQIRDLQRQAEARNRQQKALLDYLRAHGISVPRTVYVTSSVSGGGATRPKGPTSSPAAPSPHHHPAPGSPAPTPAPTAPSADVLCELAPALCSL